MFGRKKGDKTPMTHPAEPAPDVGPVDTPPLKPFSKKGTHMPTNSKPTAATPSFRPEIPKRPIDIPTRPAAADPMAGGVSARPAPAEETGSKKLVVGRDICLTGEITSCAHLVVEGRVEAALSDGQSLEITQTGLYKGEVQVKSADLSGRFEGNLTADHVVLRGTGTITGKLRYATLQVEPGGKIRGDIDLLDTAQAAADSGESQPGIANRTA